MDEFQFQKQADAAIESLHRSIMAAEENADFESEMSAGALKVHFEEPQGVFVISPNSAVRQIWISALSTSFKLDWSPDRNDFVLAKTSESMKQLMSRLMTEFTGDIVELG